MRIVTILPVSRTEYLDRVLESLRNQTLKPDSLVVVFDGKDKDFQVVYDKVTAQPFAKTICVKSVNTTPVYTITYRRINITNIHNQFRELVDGDWVFSIEDDGILPKDALEKLVGSLSPDVGMITGVELGRWGVPYVGAWEVDDVFNPTLITSLENHAGEDYVEQIDACGLYCALIRGDKYREHEFTCRNGLGPDVNLGISLRKDRLNNYLAWDVPVLHLTNNNGHEIEIPATEPTIIAQLFLEDNQWKQRKVLNLLA